jgi:hypothetical protein
MRGKRGQGPVASTSAYSARQGWQAEMEAQKWPAALTWRSVECLTAVERMIS